MDKELSKLFNTGPVVVFKWDIENSSVVSVSENAEDIFGYSLDEITSGSAFLFKVIRNNNISKITKLIFEIKKSDSDTFTIDNFEIKLKNKKIKWIKIHLKIEKNNDNKPIFCSGYAIDITNEVETEKKLKESETKYRIISEYSTDIIFMISRTGKVLYINKPVKEASGINASEVVGKNFRKFVPISEIPRCLSKLTKAFLGKEVRNFRTYAINDKKELIPIEISGKLINYKGRKVALGFVRDVSEQVEYENELKKLSSAVEFSVNGVLITDSSGRTEYLNKKYSKISGFNYSDLKGKLFRLFESRNSALFNEMSDSINSKGAWQDEFYQKTKTGKPYWEHISVAPIYSKKKEIINYIIITQDVTNRIKVEKELILAKEKAEESDRLKSAFLANMSHEIRTPLNAILGFADFIKNKDLEIEKHKKFAGIILESGTHLLDLINNIVNLAKLEAGQVEINESSVNIKDLFEELYMIFQPNIQNPDIEFSCQIKDQHLIKEFISDKTGIKQIFINLISNALKFTEKGYVKYTCKYMKDKLLFTVEDTGIGIPQNFKKEIFGRFSQVYNISEKYGGTGLGLSIVKENVKLFGGKIWLETEINKGTSFYIEFPYLLPDKKSFW